jgi:hypothetical protein
MVVIQGKNGGVVFYFENKIVGSLPLGNHTMEDYYKQRDKLLREALEDRKLKQIKQIMWRGLHSMKDSGCDRDNDFICMTILCLMKFRQIDPDGDQEGILVVPRKKPRKRLIVSQS